MDIQLCTVSKFKDVINRIIMRRSQVVHTIGLLSGTKKRVRKTMKLAAWNTAIIQNTGL